MNELRSKLIDIVSTEIDNYSYFLKDMENQWDTTKTVDDLVDAILQALPEEKDINQFRQDSLDNSQELGELRAIDMAFGYRDALTEVKHILNEARNAKS